MYKIFFAFFFFTTSLALSQVITSEVFDVAGPNTWTAPECLTAFTVEAWGAGGGSGGETSSNGGTGGGGGGAYSRSMINLIPGTTYNLEVGAAGIGGYGGSSGTATAGTDGGDSWFIDATTVMAKGGLGGIEGSGSSGGQGGDPVNSFGDVKYAGGNGGNGNLGIPANNSFDLFGGGGGSSAGYSGNGENGGDSDPNGGGGNGGTISGGNGGRGSSDPQKGSGENGYGPGGGGGGSTEGAIGADGADGQIVVSWEMVLFPDTLLNVCSESAFNLSLVSGVGGYSFPSSTTYSWDAPTVTGGLTGGSAQSGQGSISETLTNPTTTSQTATYQVTPSSASCSFEVVVTVDPLPKFTSSLSPPAICSGTFFDYTPTSDLTGVTFYWDRRVIAGVEESPESGTGIISEMLTNTSNTTIDVTYTYVFTTAACIAPPENVVVPLINPPTVTVTGSDTICVNDPVPDIVFIGTGSTPPYTFTYNINGLNETDITSDNTGMATITAPTDQPGTFTYNLINVTNATATACSQAQNESATLTVNQLSGTLAGTATVCTGENTPITFSANGSEAPYTFTYDLNGSNENVTSDGAGVATVQAPTGQSGDFVYTLSNITDANSLNCESAATSTITVYDLPSATIGSSTTICLNDPAPNITFTGTGGTPPYTFSYTEEGTPQTVSTTNGDNTVTIPALTTPVGDIVYELTNVQESSVASCDQNLSETVTVSILDPAEGNVTSSIYRVCQDDVSPSMTFTGTKGLTPFTFFYSTNVPINGSNTHSVSTVGSNTSISVTVPTDVPDTIIYTITDIQDGRGFTCGIGGSFDTLIVDALPVSTITAASNNLCVGDAGTDLVFEAFSVPSPTTFDYFISFNGGPDDPQPSLTTQAGELTYTLSFNPTNEGTYLFTNGVSDSEFCAGTNSGSTEVIVNPSPEATIALTGADTFCENSTGGVEFTGSIGTPPYTFSYDIDGGTPKTVTSASGINTAGLLIDTIPGTYTINLLAVSDTFNCNQSQIGAVTVTLDPLPTATAGGNETICMNGTANVTGTSSSYGTILWTHNGSGVLNNTTSLTPNYNAANADAGNDVVLTMTVTSDNTCNPEDSVAIYTISVDSLPLAQAGGSITICENTSTIITGTNARFGTIAWTHNGTGTLTNTTTLAPIYIATTGDVGNIVTLTMTVTSTNSCAPQTDIAIYTINVDPLPTAVAGGNTSICEDAAYQLAAGEATLTNGTPNWIVVSGLGTLSNATTLTPSYAAAVADAGATVNLLMTVTSNNSCINEIASTNYDIIIDQLPAATDANPGVVCEDGSITLNGATSSHGTNLWTIINGAGTITNPTNINTIYNAVNADLGNTVSLLLTVTSDNTCGTASATANSIINIDNLPTAAAGGSVTICESSYYELANGEASLTFGTPSWIENGAGSITAGQNTLRPTYTPASADTSGVVTLTMIVSSTNACVGRTNTAIYEITVDPLPDASSGDVLTICKNKSATITGATATPGGALIWTHDGNGILTNETSLTPTYTAVDSDAGKTINLSMAVTINNYCSNVPQYATTELKIRQAITAKIRTEPQVCLHEDTVVTFIPQTGIPPFTYFYTEQINNLPITNNNTTSRTIPAATSTLGTVVYTLTSIQDAYCTDTVNNVDTMNVFLPIGHITNGDTAYCEREPFAKPLEFTAEGKGPFRYTVKINNFPPFTSENVDTLFIPIDTYEKNTYIYSLMHVSVGECQLEQSVTDTVEIKERPEAFFTISSDNVTILEPKIEIEEGSSRSDIWEWDFGDGSTNSFEKDIGEHLYTDTGQYTIKLTNTLGFCQDTYTRKLVIEDKLLFYIPEAFTPNGDEINDTFLPKGEGKMEAYSMKIYDRWGNMVFYTDDINKGWDGKANGGDKLAQMDAYIYVVDILDSQRKHSHVYRGTLNLIR